VRVLVTGACGYLGSEVAAYLAGALEGARIVGLDNLSRRGSERNVARLREIGADFVHGDVRSAADLRALPDVDWVVDCAANPSVTAGIPGLGGSTSEQLVGHNLGGTLHMLEYCRERGAGFVLLSTSRVYSIEALGRIPLVEGETRFEPAPGAGAGIPGYSERGVAEEFPTSAPISLYGATKLASEVLALEYGGAFGFPVWIDRCGVIGGPGQFGRIDQGIFSFWAYSIALGRPLRYVGFGGSGKQVRDCVVASDVARLVLEQMNDPGRTSTRIFNVGGGARGSMSLREMTAVCARELGVAPEVSGVDETRAYDIPVYVTDNTRVRETWGWEPSLGAEEIVARTCSWATANLDTVRELFR
jgi:CDP-paratose 2-epimerase